MFLHSLVPSFATTWYGKGKKKKKKKDKKGGKRKGGRGGKKETKEKKEKRLKKEQAKLDKEKAREEQKAKKDLFNKAKKAQSGCTQYNTIFGVEIITVLKWCTWSFMMIFAYHVGFCLIVRKHVWIMSSQ